MSNCNFNEDLKVLPKPSRWLPNKFWPARRWYRGGAAQFCHPAQLARKPADPSTGGGM